MGARVEPLHLVCGCDAHSPTDALNMAGRQLQQKMPEYERQRLPRLIKKAHFTIPLRAIDLSRSVPFRNLYPDDTINQASSAH